MSKNTKKSKSNDLYSSSDEDDDDPGKKESSVRTADEHSLASRMSVGVQSTKSKLLANLPSQGDTESMYSMKNEISNFLERTDSNKNVLLSQYPGAERSQFDFSSERQAMYSTNVLGSTAHLLKAILGIGILSMHEAYKHGGTWTSLGVTAIIGFVVPYNTLMLVKIAQRMYNRLRVPKMSYPDLMEAAVGKGPLWLRDYRKCGRYLIDIILFLEMWSACSLFQVTMAKTTKKFLEAMFDTMNKMQINIRLYILFTSLPLYFLCAIKKFKYLVPFSIVADIFIVICVLVLLGYTMHEKPPLSERSAWKSVAGLFKCTGIVIYSIECISMALPIENNMETPSYFPVVLWLAYPVVLFGSTALGFFGYWKWGEECISPVILHLPENVGSMIMDFLFVIVCAVSFSIGFYVPFQITWRYIRKRIKRKTATWELTYRMLQVFILTLISLAFPYIAKLVSLIGNFLLGSLVFIFPPIIEYLVTYQDYSTFWQRVANFISLILGFTAVCGGFYSYIVSE